MEILTLTLKNGVFDNLKSEVEIESFSKKKAKAGRWIMFIDDDGSVVIKNNYMSFFRLFSFTYTLDKNGLEKLVMKRNGEVIKKIRKRKVLPVGQKLNNGYFYITTSSNDELNVLFRNTNWKEFTSENLLTDIAFKDPNGKYILRNADSRDGYCTTKLDTDGQIKTVRKIKHNLYEEEEVSVVNATWCVFEINQEELDYNADKYISKNSRELITLKDPYSLDLSSIN